MAPWQKICSICYLPIPNDLEQAAQDSEHSSHFNRLIVIIQNKLKRLSKTSKIFSKNISPQEVLKIDHKCHHLIPQLGDL